nr:hypothetical protein BaRGS_023908 [Batillaria attramentaria]
MAILRVLFRRGTTCRLRLLALANVFAFCFVVVMTLMTSAVGYFVVVPYLFAEDDATLQAHRAVIAYLFVNVIGNFLICILTDTSVARAERGVKTQLLNRLVKVVPTSPYCQERKDQVRDAKNAASEDAWKSKEGPERSHYCVLCEKTILRRDHHCFFMTVCIGYHNHKHFIFFCLYMMVGTFYGVVLIAKFLNVVYGVKFWGPQTFLFLLVKVVDKLLRHHVIPSPFFVFLLYELYACLIVGLVACGFFYWHIVISVSGQGRIPRFLS